MSLGWPRGAQVRGESIQSADGKKFAATARKRGRTASQYHHTPLGLSPFICTTIFLSFHPHIHRYMYISLVNTRFSKCTITDTYMCGGNTFPVGHHPKRGSFSALSSVCKIWLAARIVFHLLYPFLHVVSSITENAWNDAID